tara:strand:+ start:146 stop:1468 length:1323 start_codon:yes stop_codon:yes gene_type:complete
LVKEIDRFEDAIKPDNEKPPKKPKSPVGHFPDFDGDPLDQSPLSKNQQQMITKGTGINSKWVLGFRTRTGRKWGYRDAYEPAYGVSNRYEGTWPFRFGDISKSEEEAAIREIFSNGFVPGIILGKIKFDESKIGSLFREVRKIGYQEINSEGRRYFVEWKKTGKDFRDWEHIDSFANILDFINLWQAQLKNEVRDALEYHLNDTLLPKDNEFFSEMKKLITKTSYPLKTKKLIEKEGQNLEYKESIFINKENIKNQIPEKTPNRNQRIEEKFKKEQDNWELDIMKSICAFLNTDGGELIIGVKDDHTVIGMKNELKTLKTRTYGSAKMFKNKHSKNMEKITNEHLEDAYERKLADLIDFHFKDHILKINLAFVPLEKISQEIFSIKVDRVDGLEFAYVKEKYGTKNMLIPYTRSGSTDRRMEGTRWDKYQKDFIKKFNTK